MPKIISYKNRSKIVERNNKKYLYKVKRNNKEELFNYLRIKGFTNFLSPLEVTDQYEIYSYIDEVDMPKEDKAIELVNTLSFLHIKTTTYQEVNQEKVKEIYTNIKNEITYLKNYYLDLQDFIETREFMAPAEYLLMLNISKFYRALNYSERKLEAWYQKKQNTIRERIVQLHRNINLEHFLIGDDSYFINWEKSTKDLVVYDFINFYQNEFNNLEMTSLFDQYQAKYEYTIDEMLLFKTIISIPPKLTFKQSNIINVINTRDAIDYVEKTNNFLLKYYEKNQKTDN